MLVIYLTMSYAIKIKREAKHKLASLSAADRLRITEKVMDLGCNPNDPALDAKPLTGSRLWRLRVGGWRVIYDRQDDLRIIAILKIKPRGDAYK